MKRLFMVILAITLVLIFILAGCSSPAPAPTTAPAPATTSAPAPKPSVTATSTPTSTAAAAKTYKFSFSIPNPEQGWVCANALRPWLKQITDATKGAVTFDIYYDQTLSKQTQSWQAVQSGIADMAMIVHGSYPGLTPVTDALTLPFTPLDTAKKNSTMAWTMYQKFPSIQKEFQPHKLLVLSFSGPTFLTTTKKEIKKIEDFKGLRLKTGGGLPVTQAFQSLGVAPITMAAADTYMNMQKGVIDGAMQNWDMFASFKLMEVSKYFTYAPFYPGMFSVIMNGERFNSLPKDIQDAINNVSGLAGSQFWGTNQFDAAEAPSKEEVKKAGYPMIEFTFPQSEVDKMITMAGKPAWDKWVKDMKATGVSDAQDILNAILELQKTIK